MGTAIIQAREGDASWTQLSCRSGKKWVNSGKVVKVTSGIFQQINELVEERFRPKPSVGLRHRKGAVAVS